MLMHVQPSCWRRSKKSMSEYLVPESIRVTTMAQRRAMNGRIAFLSHDRLHLAVEDSDQLASECWLSPARATLMVCAARSQWNEIQGRVEELYRLTNISDGLEDFEQTFAHHQAGRHAFWSRPLRCRFDAETPPLDHTGARLRRPPTEPLTHLV